MRIQHQLILSFAVVMLWIAPATAGHINLVNKLPAKNPCVDLPKDLYDDLKSAVNDVGKSAVIDDINKTIDKTLKDNGIADTGTIDVEVSIAPDAASYKKMLDDSGGTLSEAAINKRFDDHVAWTDVTGTKPKQKIRIVIFCGKNLRTRLVDGNGPRLVIHELVHAQLYAMGIGGLPRDKEPYKEETVADFKTAEEQNRQGHSDEHNKEFSGIVERLTKLFENPPKKVDKAKTATQPKKKGGGKKSAERPRRGKAASGQAGAPVASGVQFSIGVGFGGGGGGRERHDYGDERRGGPKVSPREIMGRPAN